MYVAASNGMTPVATGTNTAGRPIKIGAIPTAIAITPDGKTASSPTSIPLRSPQS